MADPVLIALKDEISFRREMLNSTYLIMKEGVLDSAPILKGMLNGYDNCIAIVDEFIGKAK